MSEDTVHEAAEILKIIYATFGTKIPLASKFKVPGPADDTIYTPTCNVHGFDHEVAFQWLNDEHHILGAAAKKKEVEASMPVNEHCVSQGCNPQNFMARHGWKPRQSHSADGARMGFVFGARLLIAPGVLVEAIACVYDLSVNLFVDSGVNLRTDKIQLLKDILGLVAVSENADAASSSDVAASEDRSSKPGGADGSEGAEHGAETADEEPAEGAEHGGSEHADHGQMEGTEGADNGQMQGSKGADHGQMEGSKGADHGQMEGSKGADHGQMEGSKGADQMEGSKGVEGTDIKAESLAGADSNPAEAETQIPLELMESLAAEEEAIAVSSEAPKAEVRASKKQLPPVPAFEASEPGHASPLEPPSAPQQDPETFKKMYSKSDDSQNPFPEETTPEKPNGAAEIADGNIQNEAPAPASPFARNILFEAV